MSADVIQHPTFSRVAPPATSPPAPTRPRRAKRPREERLPCDRVRLALEASYELETIAIAMLGGFVVDEEAERFMHRALAIRVRDLAKVVMSVTGDDTGRETADMHEVVHGVRSPGG